MRRARADHVAVAIGGGQVLVLLGDGGSFGDLGPFAEAERYDPATATWQPAGRSH